MNIDNKIIINLKKNKYLNIKKNNDIEQSKIL